MPDQASQRIGFRLSAKPGEVFAQTEWDAAIGKHTVVNVFGTCRGGIVRQADIMDGGAAVWIVVDLDEPGSVPE